MPPYVNLFDQVASEPTLASILAKLNASLAVTGPLTDAQLRAALVPVTGPLTDAQLRAAAVAVSGTVALDAATLAALETITVIGPLTDAQLRATPVPVSGTVATGGLTDAQLRATPLPISGTVTATLAEPISVDDNGGSLTVDAVDLDVRNLLFATDKVDVSGSTAVGVTGPLTDTQLRATPVPVSGTVATGGLTDAQLRAAVIPTLDTAVRDRLPTALVATGELSVADDYQEFEALSDQTGAGSVLTFTFTSAVNLVVVHAVGTSQVARATTTQTPSATLGARCPDDAPTYLPVTTSVMKVFAPNGMLVSVCGYRRT